MGEPQALGCILDAIQAGAGELRATRKPAAAKEAERSAEEAQKLRQMFLEKEHAKECTTDSAKERALRHQATRGILQLFNAIAEHQRALRAEQQKDPTKAFDDLVDETVPTSEFLQRILSTQKKERKELKEKKDAKKDLQRAAKEHKKKKVEREKKEKEAERRKEKKERKEAKEGKEKKEKREKKPKQPKVK